MRPTLRFFAGLALAMTVATGTAVAQQNITSAQFNATITMPEGWVQVDSNERAVFNFRNDESQAQVEVIATELMTPDVADVFFDTFHNALTASEFRQSGREEKSYGGFTGAETIYTFEHSGVTLKVAVFQFTQQSNAWIVVSYVPGEQFDAFATTWQGLIGSLRIEG